MAAVTINEAIEYLDTFRTFVIKCDIPHGIKYKANYLTALGLSTYTEILGGFYSGDLSGNHRYCYDTFIKLFFPAAYAMIDSRLCNDKLKGLYNVVRSGLTHEFFITKVSRIDMDNPPNIMCGIYYNPNDKPQVIFYVKRYFEDFQNAFEEYYRRIKNDASLLTNFGKALRSVNSSLLSRPAAGGTKFIEDVSGKGFPRSLAKPPFTKSGFFSCYYELDWIGVKLKALTSASMADPIT